MSLSMSSDKIRNYRADYNNRPSNVVSFMADVVGSSGRQ